MNDSEIKRYARQILLNNIGINGQEKILSTKVLVVGLGGLGSNVAMQLVRMGIGAITVIDDDVVDISNLQRQILYEEIDIGKSKIDCGIKKLRSINGVANIKGINGKVTEENADKLVSQFDIIVDCTDNFFTRGILNRACIKNKKTCIFGSVRGFEGSMTVLFKGESACYECLMGNLNRLKELDNKNKTTGVLGATVAIIASMQAIEVIKIILNIGEISKNKLIVFNALDMSSQIIEFAKRKECFCNNGCEK